MKQENKCTCSSCKEVKHIYKNNGKGEPICFDCAGIPEFKLSRRERRALQRKGMR